MLRVLSLFSGIGAFEVALDEENIDWELDHYCEIDKYACRSYNCIHGTTDEDNLKDVTNIDYSKIGRVDLVTYGFPCQDISLAGNQKGFFDEEGNLTRSGLFFNAADVIRHTKPKFAIFENVKNLTGKKFKAEFETVLSVLDELGYNTYWKVLNAKDYGIPQNRERVFGISIRKDIDHGYEFPLPVEMTLRLKDMLEEQVEEKYYLSEQCLKGFLKHNENHEAKGTGFKWKPRELNGIASCLRANSALAPTDNTIAEPKIEQVGNIDLGNNESNNRVYSPDGLSPTSNTMQGGHRQPKILVKEATKKGYAEAEIGDSINLEQPNSKTRRGRVGKGVAQTLTTSCNQAVVEPLICASRGRNPENPSSRKAGEHTEQRLEVNTSGCSNTLTTVQKDNLVLEPSVLRYERTEYAKRIRKKYESGEISEKRSNLRQYGIRKDGCSNTLTTVQKDNYVVEPKMTYIEKALKETIEKNNGELGEGLDLYNRRVINDGCAKTLGADCGHNGTAGSMMIYRDFSIRKLTPRECWRLMGFKDKYFDKVQGVSNSQLYKQAGNSIVVDVLRAIFRELKKQYPDDFKEVWGEDL